ASNRLPLDQLFVGERLFFNLPIVSINPAQSQRIAEIAETAADKPDHPTQTPNGDVVSPASDGAIRVDEQSFKVEEGKSTGGIFSWYGEHIGAILVKYISYESSDRRRTIAGLLKILDHIRTYLLANPANSELVAILDEFMELAKRPAMEFTHAVSGAFSPD